MNNVIALNSHTAPRKRRVVERITDNIISIVEWKAAPHPVRTPNGVFFTTQTWQFSGDAA